MNKKQLLVYPLCALALVALPTHLQAAEEQDSIKTTQIEPVIIRS